jgi:alpha-1,3-rhamnosyl/mannosyltransferase
MIRQLHRNPDVDLRLLASRDQLVNGRALPAHHPLHEVPVVGLPLSRIMRESLWLGLNTPVIDRYVPKDSWIYCSMETYVPTQQCRRIVTVHHLESPVVAHRLSVKTLKEKSRNFRLRKAIRTADLVVAQSTFTREGLVSRFLVPPERIRVVGSGVTEEYFAVPNNADLYSLAPDFSPYVLITGALDSRKGADYMLNVARLLAKRNSPVRLVCTAGLYGVPAYISAARALSNVVLLNFVSRHELLAHYRKAAALLCLSRLEGFGLPLVEAMAAGLPVIAANNTAIPETLGGAGVLVAPENTEQVVDAIERLLHDKAFRDELTANGLVRARNFTWEVCMQRLLAGIRTVPQPCLKVL